MDSSGKIIFGCKQPLNSKEVDYDTMDVLKSGEKILNELKRYGRDIFRKVLRLLPIRGENDGVCIHR